MNDLTAREQKAVRTALRFLRLRVGAWGPLAKALRCEWDSIQKVATGKRAVTPALALRVARFAVIPMDELLAGQWLSARVCPHCGHPPDDFIDEETLVEQAEVTKLKRRLHFVAGVVAFCPMSTKIVCDGCGADTTPPFKPPFSSPGQLGDGLARQLELRLGNNMVKMDLCIACHKRAQSWLVEAFPEMARTCADWWPAMALNEATEGTVKEHS